MIRRALLIASLLTSLSLALTCSLAGAASKERDTSQGSVVTIMKVDTSQFPNVRVAYGADEHAGKPPRVTFYENGDALSGVKIYRGDIGNYENRKRTDVMIAIDTSLSMGNGSRLDDAKSAAEAFLDQAHAGDRIGLATFGGVAKVLVKPTDDLAAVRTKLADLSLANRTTMFDAVKESADAFSGRANRAIIVLSDGTDAESDSTSSDAIAAANHAHAPIFAVSIAESELVHPPDMSKLASGTSGVAQTVIGSTGLHAVFAELGRQILQPYWIEYHSSAPVSSQVKFAIAAGGDTHTIDASRTFTALATGGAPLTSTKDIPAAHPAAPLLPIPHGNLGAFLASLPFALMVFWLTWRWLERRSRPDVIARIERYTQLARHATETANEPRRRRGASGLLSPIARLADAFLSGSKFFARIRARAEQANIPIKPAELFATMVVAGVGGLLIGLLTGRIPFVLGFAGVGYYLPMFWLRRKARKRRTAFEDQLPDVLQGISSSLRAGHSFNQALNAMIKDAASPTSEEFARVMTEARLGMPIEDALQHMAERLGSADFEFAVTTVNIQRTVGGSLAEILAMVGDTVRHRQQFRKKVKALTSMGQMSAYVLLGMPIVMALVLTLLNPGYMRPMFETSTGHIMMIIGMISMTLGYFACMKIVKVKV